MISSPLANPNLAKLGYISEIFKSSYPILSSTVDTAFDTFGTSWLNNFIYNVETLFSQIIPSSDNPLLFNAIEAYSEFCADALRHQSFFERYGHYMNSSAAYCLDNYYSNDEYMTNRYLPGLWLSHYLWPHHYNMLNNFSSRISHYIRHPHGLFYEIGVGCGIYSKTILENIPNVRGIGIDISDSSLNFTNSVISSFGYSQRYSTQKHDIFDGIDQKADFLVCQEVLEHVEDPSNFCKALSDMLMPGGRAFITAALNAAHSDHIYLFSNTLQLEDMLRAAGFIPLAFQEEFAYFTKPRNLTPSLAGFYCIKS